MFSNSGIDETISRIGSVIMQDKRSFFLRSKKNQRIELKLEEQICFLTAGEITIYRILDSMVTITIKSPAVIGLAYINNENIPAAHFLRCETECEMWAIKSSDAVEIFDTFGLWRDAFKIISHNLNIYFQREAMLYQPNIRCIVIENAKYLWGLDQEIRDKTSIYTFILSRNIVSRSAVHKALRELTDEGIIKLRRGKLCSLNI